VQESLMRAREALWAIERRENSERREKFEQLAAIDEASAGRFWIDTEPKKTPAATTRPRARQRTNSVASLSALKRDTSVAVRLAHDQADGLTLQARLAQGVRFRSTTTNSTSIKGEKRNRTIAKLIRSWQLFKTAGDTNGMAEATGQLARLGITRT
jgi:23S rRNA G2069 N7-methylase RlmK/C1962 C5-methylase RlmI